MTSRTFTDEYNALVKQLEELCNREGISFYGNKLDEYGPNLEEVVLTANEWQSSGCTIDDSNYWQSSRC